MPSGINFIKKSTSFSLANFFGDPYGYLRYSASGDLSESVVKGFAFSSREPDGFVRRKHTAKKDRRFCLSFFAGDPYGTRTHVTTVKGWCLNRLTNGPSPCAFAHICNRLSSVFCLGSGDEIRTYDLPGMNRTL